MFDNMSKQTLSNIAADLRSHMPSDPTFLARVGQLLRELINAEVMGRPDDHPMEVKPEPAEPAEVDEHGNPIEHRASTEPGETQPDPALTDGETGEHWDPATPEPSPTGPQYDAPKPPPGVQTAPPLAADIHR